MLIAIRRSIYFEWNKDTLGDLAKENLGKLYTQALGKARNASPLSIMEAEIIGHADTSELFERNIALSAQRANTVRRELITLGALPSCLSVSCWASQQMAVPIDTEVREPLNRRVEVTLRVISNLSNV